MPSLVSLLLVDGSSVVQRISSPLGTSISDALRLAGYPPDLPCGGRGVCKGCRVVLLTSDGERVERLACATRLEASETRVDFASLPKRGGKIESPEERAFDSGAIELTSEERSGALGLAVDIGTTTVVSVLVSLTSGRTLGIRSTRNPQIAFGRDAISRIDAGSRDLDVARTMRRDVARTIEASAGELLASFELSASHLTEVVVAGNTTMEFLFVGRDVAPLGSAPFDVGERSFAPSTASSFDWDFAPGARVRCFPVFSAFIGGDVLSGFAYLRARGALGNEQNGLLLDVGTNGESILSARGRLYATSTAAGPAFEGAGITQGTPAVFGAIRAISWDVDASSWRPETIGGVDAIGVCGSGLIDALAGALDFGVLAPSGRLRTRDAREVVARSSEFRARLFERGKERVSAIGAEDSPERVVLTQRDVRQAQLALGAMKAGRAALLDSAGLDGAALDSFYIAGGFGASLNRAASRRVGLVPAELPNERVFYCGNSSLFGAVDALLGRVDLNAALELCGEMTLVDLAARPNFAEEFASATTF